VGEAAVADKTVTLIKDTQRNLPLRPKTHRRIRLYGITGQADFTGTDPSGYLTRPSRTRRRRCPSIPP
jgi:beta-N-acetylhexosaminidase